MHSAEFKARVALGAIRGIKTVQQIAADNELVFGWEKSK
jgi:transposase-like protein